MDQNNVLLKCSNCNIQVIVPFFECPTCIGGVVCKSCYRDRKIKKCNNDNRLCDELLVPTASSSPLCDNWHWGCEGLKSGGVATMNAHLARECEFRPIRCFFTSIGDCNGVTIKLEHFSNHMSSHKLKIFGNKDTGRYIKRTKLADFSKNGRMNITIKLLGDKAFIQHNKVENDRLMYWFSVVGNKETASRYFAVVKPPIQKPKPVEASEDLKNATPKLPWRLPILSIQDSQFETVRQRKGVFGSIPCKGLYDDSNIWNDQIDIVYKYCAAFMLESPIKEEKS